MSADPGPILAQGRASIIYDLRDGTVLRRYVGSDRSAEPEAEVMRHAAEAGVSVPVVHSASGPDIRMDLVPGPTMLADLASEAQVLVPLLEGLVLDEVGIRPSPHRARPVSGIPSRTSSPRWLR